MKLTFKQIGSTVFFNNIKFSVIGGVFARVLLMLMYIFLARILKPDLFGKLITVNSAALFGSVIASFGIPVVLLRFIPQFKQDASTDISKALSGFAVFGFLSSVLYSVIFFMISDWLACFVFKDYSLSFGLKISSFYLLVVSVSSIQIGFLSGYEEFKIVAKLNTIGSLLSLFIVLLLAYTFSIIGALFGFCISGLILVVYNQIELKKCFNKNNVKLSGFNFEITKYTFNIFILPLFFSTVVVSPLSTILNYFLVSQSNQYDEVGVFNVAFQWYNAVLFLPSLFANILLPHLTRQFYNNNNNLNRFIFYNLLLNGLASLFFVFVIYLGADFIIEQYGKGYYQGKAVLTILLPTAILVSCISVLGQVLVSRGKIWLSFSLNLVWICAIFFFNNLFIGEGAVGVSKSLLFSYVVLGGLTFMFTVKYLRFTI